MKKIRMFIHWCLRPVLGYKYKIVYTEIDIKSSFQKRYLAKLKSTQDNIEMLAGIPRPHGRKYIPPVTLYWSRTKKNLGTRVLIPKEENIYSYFSHYFK